MFGNLMQFPSFLVYFCVYVYKLELSAGKEAIQEKTITEEIHKLRKVEINVLTIKHSLFGIKTKRKKN
jgi:hypothetical protein